MRIMTFIRHGQSLANAGGVTMAHAEIPLTDLGSKQAKTVASFLPPAPTEILSSPFVRAVETSRPYSEQCAVQVRHAHVLQEFDAIDPTLLAGMTGEQRRPIADAYWTEADPSKRMGVRAETFQEFAARVQDFRTNWMPVLSQEVVVFGHGIWLGMLFWQLIGFKTNDSAAMKAFRRFQLGLPMPNCAVYRFEEVKADRWLPTAVLASIDAA